MPGMVSSILTKSADTAVCLFTAVGGFSFWNIHTTQRTAAEFHRGIPPKGIGTPKKMIEQKDLKSGVADKGNVTNSKLKKQRKK